MKTVIAVKTEPRVKERADQIAKQLGIPLSTVMHGLLLQFIRDKRVSLGLSSSDVLSKHGESLVEDALQDTEEYTFDSPGDMIAAANKLK